MRQSSRSTRRLSLQSPNQLRCYSGLSLFGFCPSLKAGLTLNGLPFRYSFTFQSNPLTTIAHTFIRKTAGFLPATVSPGVERASTRLKPRPVLD
jgi:hypothetical protein